jgi:hypothetical protein
MPRRLDMLTAVSSRPVPDCRRFRAAPSAVVARDVSRSEPVSKPPQPWESGLVGTSGTATELVHQQVVESFNGNKALVLAALFGEDMPQSKRNTEKRDQLRRG